MTASFLARLFRACVSACVVLIVNNGEASSLSQNEGWKAPLTSEMVPIRQPYRNEQYGFEVPSVPAAQAYQAKEPNPNHGVVIILGERRVITVSAEFDAAELGSATAYLDVLLQSEKSRDSRIQRYTLRSAGRSRAQATIRQGELVKVLVTLRRHEHGGVNYALILETTPSEESRDYQIFQRIVRGLKFLPRPR